MVISGVFNDQNSDASEITSGYKDSRRAIAKEVTKKDGTKWYRYELATTINLGIAKQDIPLPKNIPIRLCFNRAMAKMSCLQIEAQQNGQNVTYPELTIPIISPCLHCYFVESEKADNFYGKSRQYDIG